MNKLSAHLICLLLIVFICSSHAQNGTSFPDGSAIPEWFNQTEKIDIRKLGEIYRITEHGIINDSSKIQTTAIQTVIDKASEKGGVVYVPKGTFLTGALFFKPNTHLYLEKGAVLKGSDNIADYPQLPSRMEGQNLDYFAALINAYGVDGFTISGKGTINGNGLAFWKAFWQRRAENSKCTNLEVSRPRLVFIRNCKDVRIDGVRLINSGFWTTHLYQCQNVKLLNLHIFSPVAPVKAPSTDAVDIDACTNVLIKNCYLSVNDDAIALKGGKGPWADKDTVNNGSNQNIIIEGCEFGFCHGVLTFGSESIHDRNIILRNCTVKKAQRMLWLKMRPDTPQNYEYVLVENIEGNVGSLLFIKPWTQFFDLKGRQDMPVSQSNQVTLRNIKMTCKVFFDVKQSDNYQLSNFTFENFNVKAEKGEMDKSFIENLKIKNLKVNGQLLD